MSSDVPEGGAPCLPNGAEQDAVIAFLNDPSSYDPPPDSVQRIDTHAAIVFLAGERVFKIKRAVRLPYLDFSTLEKRHNVCLREVALNRVTAPDLYLGVVPIVRDEDGRLALNAAGTPVEWAVEMVRFDQSCLFERLASDGRLNLDLMLQLADHIADFHAKAIADPLTNGEAAMSRVISSTVAAVGAAPDGIPRSSAESYARQIWRALHSNADLLRDRSASGHVRLCHGDLHLRNIVLLDQRPTLFDCIEFDDGLATIDILYDLAFVLMDLWHRGLERHANVLLNGYLQSSGDLDNLRALSALPLFLACRAAVRAMVTLDYLPNLVRQAQSDVLAEAAGYVESARNFLVPRQPRLIAIGGLSGTGKSTLGAALSPDIGAAPGALHFRSDIERKAMFDVAATVRLGEDAYTHAVTDRVYEALNRKARMTLEAGHAVVVDAVFLLPEQRRALEQVAQDAGVSFSGVWLTAPESTLVERVTRRMGDASDADAAIVKQQMQLPTGPVSWQAVDADATAAATLDAAARALGVSLT